MSDKLYVWSNEYEWFVAGPTIDDLKKVYDEFYGPHGEWEEIVEYNIPFRLDDDKEITIWGNDELFGDPYELPDGFEVIAGSKPPLSEWTHQLKATAANWAKFNGPGFLCSTEW